MGSEVVGASPRRIVRVAICSETECEERGIPIQVPGDQMTYLCSCGQEIPTQLYNLDAHEKTRRLCQEDRSADIDSTVRWCYAPQLSLDKDGGEPYEG